MGFWTGQTPRRAGIDAANLTDHTARMAKNPGAELTTKTPKRNVTGKEDSLAPSDGERAGVRGRPSSLLDTRVIYGGDNLEQLAKLPDACVDLIYIDPPFNSNRNYEVICGESKEKRAFEDRTNTPRHTLTIYPVSSAATPRKQEEGELGLMERWYPIQAKQKDKVGRPDIGSFEASGGGIFFSLRGFLLK
jgi:hypothetical protein